jgi:hypothetical protein
MGNTPQTQHREFKRETPERFLQKVRPRDDYARTVSAAVMWGRCKHTSSGPRMLNTTPEGHFIKRLHGLPGP